MSLLISYGHILPNRAFSLLQPTMHHQILSEAVLHLASFSSVPSTHPYVCIKQGILSLACLPSLPRFEAVAVIDTHICTVSELHCIHQGSTKPLASLASLAAGLQHFTSIPAHHNLPFDLLVCTSENY